MTGIKWQDEIGTLSATTVKAVEAKFASANRHVLEGEASLLRAGRELRIALNTHLKNDKAAFEVACKALFDRSVSAAYEYVQAADAEKVFGQAVGATGTDAKTVGVRTWAKLDRFAGSDEKKAEGLEVIKAEAARAKAEGTKAFTNTGLADSIKAVKGGGGESTGTDDDRRIGRIAGKYRDDFRHEFARFVGVMTEHGERAAFAFAVRQGSEWGAASGASTALALTALTIEWAAEDKAIQAEAKRAEAKAAKQAKALEGLQGQAASLAPAPKPEPVMTEAKTTAAKAKAKVWRDPKTGKAQAPKRSVAKASVAPKAKA